MSINGFVLSGTDSIFLFAKDLSEKIMSVLVEKDVKNETSIRITKNIPMIIPVQIVIFL